jgi:signal transduction histidine kinase
MTVIMGHANLLQRRIGQDERLQRSVEQILTASERAAGLTHSLLLYSRKQVCKLAVVDVNRIVNDMQGLLQGVFRENISLKFQLDPRQLAVKMDSRQMEQVIMNLFTNARDAMADGGEITLTTGSVQLSIEEADLHRLASPGGYCIVTIRDTGDGMDDETRRRIFEPFFTTKEVGKGTGLGLAVAFGIINNHNGQIECESQPGAGTVFHIYLPLADEEIARQQEIAPTSTSPAWQEAILFADD